MRWEDKELQPTRAMVGNAYQAGRNTKQRRVRADRHKHVQ